MVIKVSVNKKNVRKLTNKIYDISLNELPKITITKYKTLLLENIKPFKKSGKLTRSWKITTLLKGFATLKSSMPYAAIQNYGGKIGITAKMRAKMWVLYKQFGLPVYKAIAITKRSYVTIKPKNYINVDEKKLQRRVQQAFNKIIKKI